MRIVTCITEPRGNLGLEGFQYNHKYELEEKYGMYFLYSIEDILGVKRMSMGATFYTRSFWHYFTEKESRQE